MRDEAGELVVSGTDLLQKHGAFSELRGYCCGGVGALGDAVLVRPPYAFLDLLGYSYGRLLFLGDAGS